MGLDAEARPRAEDSCGREEWMDVRWAVDGRGGEAGVLEGEEEAREAAGGSGGDFREEDGFDFG